ncbi:MAG: helix-turn-helix domain-containing protein [Odoribacter sp.]|nr:helix-turn-helix domain-containing protein [Odoribacter sp.]
MKFKVIREDDYKKIKSSCDKLLEQISALCHAEKINEKWMDAQEVCLLLNISKRTLRHYQLRGILPYSIIGNKSYFKIEDIEQLIENSNN